MKRIVCLALLLASGLACERTDPNEIFAPAEAGLTLAYENPSLPQPRRTQERMQVRVAKVEQAGNKLMVTKTFTTLEGQLEVLFAYQEGGVVLMRDAKIPVSVVLPMRFPNVRPWEEHDRHFSIEGRAALTDNTLRLPDTMNRVGVWVVSEPLEGKGPLRRTFYLPRLGEVETQEFQEGRWVTINRLFSFGFQDLPFTTSKQTKN